MNKRGEFLWSQVGSTIFSVGAILILISLAYMIFTPAFDKRDETAKSYFETFQDEIKTVDKDGSGEFFIWKTGDGNKEKDFYLVYFGSAIEVVTSKQIVNPEYNSRLQGVSSKDNPMYIGKDILFNSFGGTSNRICICYVEEYNGVCNYCEDLEYPVEFADEISFGNAWISESGHRISISLDSEEDKYVFQKA